jgi:hypothetical protein
MIKTIKLATRFTCKIQIVVMLFLCVVGTLNAAEVNKCIIDGRTTYQTQSCPPNGGLKLQTANKVARISSEHAQLPQKSAKDFVAKQLPLFNNVISSVTTFKSQFSCDSRTRCPQMNSCAEATFFLKNCPGVQMDGDHDGIPCEEQWCQ